MLISNDVPIKLHATHSNTTQRLAEQRFYKNMTICQVKEILSRKFGTVSDYINLQLIHQTGEINNLQDENKTLLDNNAEDFDTIHVSLALPNKILGY